MHILSITPVQRTINLHSHTAVALVNPHTIQDWFRPTTLRETTPQANVGYSRHVSLFALHKEGNDEVSRPAKERRPGLVGGFALDVGHWPQARREHIFPKRVGQQRPNGPHIGPRFHSSNSFWLDTPPKCARLLSHILLNLTRPLHHL